MTTPTRACCGYQRTFSGQGLGLCLTCGHLGPRATTLMAVPERIDGGAWDCAMWVALRVAA